MSRYLILIIFLSHLTLSSSYTFYLSPSGSDNNPGTESSPWATPQRAQQQIRTIKQQNGGNLPQPVQVNFKPGTYQLNSTWTLTDADSGTGNNLVSYNALAGGPVKISGGLRITGWTKQGDFWVARAPQGIKPISQLWANGARLLTARTPVMQFQYMESGTSNYIIYKPGQIADSYTNPNDLRITIYHFWTASIHTISSIDRTNRKIYLKNPVNGRWSGPASNNRYYLDNVYEELKSSTESFYFNSQTNLISLNLNDGADPNNLEIIAPNLVELLVLNGSPQKGIYVRGLRFNGLQFLNSLADYENCLSSTCDGQSASFLETATINAIGVQDTIFDSVTIANTGGYGIWFNSGSSRSGITNSHLFDLGAGGVRIGLPVSGSESNANLRTEYVFVNNSIIEDGGHVYFEGTGVFAQQVSSISVTHNLIRNLKYTGISVGWTWGYAPTTTLNNYIGFNHIYNIGMDELSDMGCIYTLGIQPGTVVYNNLCHNVQSYGYGGWGYYTDEGSSHITYQNNIVYHTKSAGLHQHYGENNLFTNNIFALTGSYPCDDGCNGAAIRSSQHPPGSGPGAFSSFTFQRNLVYIDNDLLFYSTIPTAFSNMTFDNNLYWSTLTHANLPFPPSQRPVTFAEWQKEGKDIHSILADPLFVAPNQFNFELRADSPAFKLGFKPIDTSKIGPQ